MQWRQQECYRVLRGQRLSTSLSERQVIACIIAWRTSTCGVNDCFHDEAAAAAMAGGGGGSTFDCLFHHANILPVATVTPGSCHEGQMRP